MKNTTRSNNFKSGFLPVLALLLIVALSGCFTPMNEEGQGTVSVTIGGSGAVRAAWLADPSALSHTITVSGGPGEAQKQEGVRAGQTASFKVAPGRWTIQVEAYDGDDLKAEGVETGEVLNGKYVTIIVRMDPVIPAGATEKELQALIDGAEDGAALRLSGTITIKNAPIKIENKEITLTTRSGAQARVARDLQNVQHPLIEVGSGGVLVLEGLDNGEIILDGMKVVCGEPLINIIYGTTLIMNNGAFLINNENPGELGIISNNPGGAVFTRGTFIMNGGTIKDNFSYFGGGVYVDNGTFTMSGGTITSNTVTGGSYGGSGGGVYVDYGIFAMSGGSIMGNAATGSGSYGGTGGGVCVDAGTFAMSGGTISGNNATGDSDSTKGGGVYVGSGIFNLNSPATKESITGNTAPIPQGNGPQVYVHPDNGTFNVDGVPQGSTDCIY